MHVIGAKYRDSSGIGSGVPLGLLACAKASHCKGHSSSVPDSWRLCSDCAAILFCFATSRTMKNNKRNNTSKC